VHGVLVTPVILVRDALGALSVTAEQQGPTLWILVRRATPAGRTRPLLQCTADQARELRDALARALDGPRA
jgi:hypothetical protein